MWHKLWRRRCLLQETVCSDAGCGAFSGTLPLIITACLCMIWLSKGGEVSRCDCLVYGARHAVGTYLPTFRRNEVPPPLPSALHAACHIQKCAVSVFTVNLACRVIFVTRGRYFIWQLALLHPYRFTSAAVHTAVCHSTHILVQYFAVMWPLYSACSQKALELLAFRSQNRVTFTKHAHCMSKFIW